MLLLATVLLRILGWQDFFFCLISKEGKISVATVDKILTEYNTDRDY